MMRTDEGTTRHPLCEFPVHTKAQDSHQTSPVWAFTLVPEVGLEPTQCYHRRILNPLRLPIPPLRLCGANITGRDLDLQARALRAVLYSILTILEVSVHHAVARRFVTVALGVCSLIGSACAEPASVQANLSGEGVTLASAQPPVIPPLFDAPRAVPARTSSPTWSSSLPIATIHAKAGDKVWATIPESHSELAEPSLYTLESVTDNTAVLISRKRRRVEGVPGAVIHRISPPIGLRRGSVALVSTFTTPALLARIVQFEPGKPIRARYDWAGETREIDVDHAELPRRGISAMAYVAYPKIGEYSRGLLVAADANHAWIWTSSGHVERHPLKKIQPLVLGTGIYKPGDRVRAYRWSQGIRHGTIAEVLEPDLRYRVHFRGNRPSEIFFFNALLPR